MQYPKIIIRSCMPGLFFKDNFNRGHRVLPWQLQGVAAGNTRHRPVEIDHLYKGNYPQKVVQPFGVDIGVIFADPPGDRLPVCGSKHLPAL